MFTRQQLQQSSSGLRKGIEKFLPIYNEWMNQVFYDPQTTTGITPSFKSLLFQNNPTLQNILEGKSTLKQGDEDPFASTTSNPGPIHLIREALRMAGMDVRNEVMTGPDLFDQNLGDAVKTLRTQNEIYDEDGDIKPVVDAELISFLDDIVFFDELQRVAGDTQPAKLYYPPKDDAIPGPFGLLQLAVGQKTIPIYKELLPTDQEMLAEKNVLANVPDKTGAKFISGKYRKTWTEVEAETDDHKTFKGYINNPNYPPDNFNMGNMVEVHPPLFNPDATLGEAGRMNLFMLLGPQKFAIGDAPFEAMLYYVKQKVSDGGTIFGDFVIRLTYTGKGFSNFRYVDLTITETEMGFSARYDDPKRTMPVPFFSYDAKSKNIVFYFQNKKVPEGSPTAQPVDNDWSYRKAIIAVATSENTGWVPSATNYVFSLEAAGYVGDPKENPFALPGAKEKDLLASMFIVPDGSIKKGTDHKLPDEKSVTAQYAHVTRNALSSLAISKSVLDSLVTGLDVGVYLANWPGEALTHINPENAQIKSLRSQVDSELAAADHSNLLPRNCALLCDIAIETRSTFNTMRQILIGLGGEESQDEQLLIPNAKDVYDLYVSALSNAFNAPEVAIADLTQAREKYAFFSDKYNALLLQNYGGVDQRVAGAEQQFKFIQGDPARRPGNALIDGILVSELHRESYSVNVQRDQFFGSNYAAVKPKMDAPDLSLSQMTGLLYLVIVQYALEQAHVLQVELEKQSTFHPASLDEGYEDYEKDNASLERLITSASVAFNTPSYSRNYEIDRVVAEFYEIIGGDLGGYFQYIKGLNDDLVETANLNITLSSVFINVIAFIAAEILTLGTASVFAGTILAGAETAAELTSGFNAFRLITSTTYFTLGSELMSPQPMTASGFAGDLFTNALMFGVMGYFGNRFSKMLFEAKVSEGAKLALQQGFAVGMLQSFAEIENIVVTGEVMNDEQRKKSFWSNVGLHFAMQVSGAALNGVQEAKFNSIASEILAKNASENITTSMTLLSTYRLELIKQIRSVAETKRVTMDFVKALENFQQRRLTVLEQLDALASRKEKAEIESLQAAIDFEYQKVIMALQMEMGGLVDLSGVGQMQMLVTIGPDQYAFDGSDEKTVRAMVTSSGWEWSHVKEEGELSKTERKNGEEVYRAVSPNGKEVYFVKRKGLRLGNEKRQKMVQAEVWIQLEQEGFFNDPEVQKALRMPEEGGTLKLRELISTNLTMKELEKRGELNGKTVYKEVEVVEILQRNITYDEYAATEPPKNVLDKLRAGVDENGHPFVALSKSEIDVLLVKDNMPDTIVEVKSGSEAKPAGAANEIEKKILSLNLVEGDKANNYQQYRIYEMKAGNVLGKDLSPILDLSQPNKITRETAGPQRTDITQAKDFDISLKLDADSFKNLAEEIYADKDNYIK